MFGTDSPWCDQKQSKEWILHTDLTGEEKEKILGRECQEAPWIFLQNGTVIDIVIEKEYGGKEDGNRMFGLRRSFGTGDLDRI